MSKENRIALIILAIGSLLLLLWYLMPQNVAVQISQEENVSKETIILPEEAASYYRKIPEAEAYLSLLRQSIARKEPFVPLDASETDAKGLEVQRLLAVDQRFIADGFDGDKTLHTEMMRIIPAIRSVLDDNLSRLCDKGECYMAEKFNFVTDTTVRAIVDVAHKRVLRVARFPGMQPDISKRLQYLAEAIALSSSEVRAKLGFTPRRKDISMANVRGTMKGSPCDNKTHLCVAPTFADQRRERALWAVVDLTALRLAAAKWAPLGKTTTPACIDERALQNRSIMEHFCQKDTLLHRDGWQIRYRLTGSDGLEIRDVRFRGKAVLRSAKIVDWHVAYAQTGASQLDETTQTYIEGRRVEFVKLDNDRYLFGYNDAMGCPMFSTSVVLPFGAPQLRSIPDGFALIQDFRNPKWPMACNYRYENRFEFYRDGSFRIVGTNKGRGCGADAIYRPVMRIDLAHSITRFYTKRNDRYVPVRKEFFQKVPETDAPVYRMTDEKGSGYALIPNIGQYGDASRGDHATLFVTRYVEAEGDEDFLTLGSCCKLDEDGPERYVNGESIDGKHFVLWYVPRIRNDDRKGHEYCWADSYIDAEGNLGVKVWPCSVGPRFVPVRSKGRGE